jgi:carbamoyl-phosphate synthase large subunit
MNVLVTGCGGDIGQSVGKILKEISFVNKIIGCDISIETPSKYIYDFVLLSVPCNDDGYLEDLNFKIKDNKIDLIIPISEKEIRYFSQKEIYRLNGCHILLTNKTTTDVCFDKLQTVDFLRQNGFPYPKTYPLNNPIKILCQINLPIILKSRFGSGSKNIFLIDKHEELIFYKEKFGDYIVQEKIGGTSNEFTCGLFRSKAGIIRTLIVNRELSGGFTAFGRVEDHENINELLINVAERLNLVGSINVQLKYFDNTPYIFEINPRFSSTVRFRDLIGFRDLLWTIQDICEYKISDFVPVEVGTKFFKGYNEYIELNG